LWTRCERVHLAHDIKYLRLGAPIYVHFHEDRTDELHTIDGHQEQVPNRAALPRLGQGCSACAFVMSSCIFQIPRLVNFPQQHHPPCSPANQRIYAPGAYRNRRTDFTPPLKPPAYNSTHHPRPASPNSRIADSSLCTVPTQPNSYKASQPTMSAQTYRKASTRRSSQLKEKCCTTASFTPR
jgi:hypothetical protein